MVTGLVALGEVGGEDYGSLQAFGVDVGEYLQGQLVDLILGPLPLVLGYQSILEESQGLMSPKSHQVFQRADALQSFVHGVLPPRKLSRRIDIMGLLVTSELDLRLGIEVDHGPGQGVCVGPQGGHSFEHRSIEGPVNLGQRVVAGEIDEHEWSMAEEPLSKLVSSRVCGGIASSNELDSFQGDPLLVLSPEPVLLRQLP